MKLWPSHLFRRKALKDRLSELPADVREPAEALLLSVRAANLTYVGVNKLRNLAWAALDVGMRRIPGSYLEAGVALGGTAILLSKLRPPETALLLYDVFATIPAPGKLDGHDAHDRYEVIASGKSGGLGGAEYYGYVPDLLSRVQENMRSYGALDETGSIQFIKGLYEDTLHPASQVALAHIDCDWHDSVKVCIDRIYPHLSAGGIMVFDDYGSYSAAKRRWTPS